MALSSPHDAFIDTFWHLSRLIVHTTYHMHVMVVIFIVKNQIHVRHVGAQILRKYPSDEKGLYVHVGKN